MKVALLVFSFLFASIISFAQDEPVAVDTAVVVEEETTDEDYYYADSVSLAEANEDAPPAGTIVKPGDTRESKNYVNQDVSVRKFDNKKWKDIVGDQTFEEQKPKPEKERKPRTESESPGFSMPGIDPTILKAISFVVVFVLFAFILYYVSKNTTLSQSIKKMKTMDATSPVENIEELDTEAMLKDALARGDLRLAVRIHYLLLLKKLNEVGLIIWKKNKTNRDYLSELYGRNSVYEDVRRLTVAYEIVWYGERSVSSESFQRLSGEFESVNRQVNPDKPTA